MRSSRIKEPSDSRRGPWLLGVVLGASLLGAALVASAQIGGSAHDLGSGSGNTVRADPSPTPPNVTTDQICVFCHTPHAGEGEPWLWNRPLEAEAAFTPYDSGSLDYPSLEGLQLPGDSSRVCLSCHSGQATIGGVLVVDSEILAPGEEIQMLGTETDGTMPVGTYGEESGFTRRLGNSLTNDHPISMTYDSALATADGELRTPTETEVIRCGSCHDPHLGPSAKYLRYNRLQQAQPAGSGAAFDEGNDIICLKCHFKDKQTAGAMLGWAESAHANSLVAAETYASAAATVRDFDANVPVWQVACLNCHDTHVVTGSRRLLREGVDELDSSTDLTTPKAGGSLTGATEEVCFQCHTSDGQTILNTAGNEVPDIETDFGLAITMPITKADQPINAATEEEVHDIEDSDFYEAPSKLGKGDLDNRHAECTDCHNPHRVIKNQAFNDPDPGTPDAEGTHDHSAPHDNIASGVLRGSLGVEPSNFANNEFTTEPVDFALKAGDGGAGASAAVGSDWLTREYQLCFRCHSNYAYDTPPSLNNTAGGTPSGTNGLTSFTNQAMEFFAPATHADEAISVGSDGGAHSNYNNNNHRSWHPVWNATGRTNGERSAGTAAWRSPWQNDVGTQTMFCSDCHGNSTGSATVVPTGSNPWGPHGSTQDFLLKGTWDGMTGTNSRSAGGATTNALCFKCHNPSIYADRNGGGATGFADSGENLHAYHTDKIEKLRCNWCHVAVPHGFKNKSLLANLNDVGPEVGLSKGTQVRNHTSSSYSNPPYYNNTFLKIDTIRRADQWQDQHCGSAGAPGNGQTGRDWMRDSDENCDTPP